MKPLNNVLFIDDEMHIRQANRQDSGIGGF